MRSVIDEIRHEQLTMRISLIADARSPISRGWFAAVVSEGHEIQVLSTYATTDRTMPWELRILPTLPATMTRFTRRLRLPRAVAPSRQRPAKGELERGSDSRSGRLMRDVRLAGELAFGPVVHRSLGRALDEFTPELVHAIRIPYEAVLALPAMRQRAEPLAVSVWGNDLELFAKESPYFDRVARPVLRRAGGMHFDCYRDEALAREMGFHGPSLVIPTSGGVDTATFHPGAASDRLLNMLDVESGTPLIFNPRGYRDYVRNDVFFGALPTVFARFPDAVVITVGLENHAGLRQLAQEVGIEDSVRFLPPQAADGMADLFRAATVSVSPSLHDGTPNTLLEAMACGTFPIAGDIESVREWISDGANGLLVDPTSKRSLAEGMMRGIGDAALRRRAIEANLTIVDTRAARTTMRGRITDFYELLIATGKPS